MRKSGYIIIVLVLIGSYCALAQDITETQRDEIIDSVIGQLANRYVDPNLGKKAADVIRQKKEKQVYDNLDQKAKLIQALVADMHEATDDKHLQLVDPNGFSRSVMPESGGMRPNIQAFNPNATSQSQMKQNKLIQEMLKRMNYGLRDTKVLEGNIGYVDIRQFVSPRMAPEIFKAIDNTMKTFKDCSTVILDLRWCSAGGDPETTMYIASYFFDSKQSVLFYESYNREKEKNAEFRTRTDIAGKYLPDVPLYILVGSKTFSAGEMFAYGLQKIGRAKIVGETSAGAAHETNTISIGHGIMMVIPVNRLAHAKTNTNWQGRGVIPDIPTTEDDALNVAQDIIQKAKRNDK
jgi:hypothetical protein